MTKPRVTLTKASRPLTRRSSPNSANVLTMTCVVARSPALLALVAASLARKSSS
ncbi:MAG: hypothetical protein M3P96_07560 [Actinomycetota bacterium]|nr:hypothetical protein [Actinomycetota bacterium]